MVNNESTNIGNITAGSRRRREEDYIGFFKSLGLKPKATPPRDPTGIGPIITRNGFYEHKKFSKRTYTKQNNSTGRIETEKKTNPTPFLRGIANRKRKKRGGANSGGHLNDLPRPSRTRKPPLRYANSLVTPTTVPEQKDPEPPRPTIPKEVNPDVLLQPTPTEIEPSADQGVYKQEIQDEGYEEGKFIQEDNDEQDGNYGQDIHNESYRQDESSSSPVIINSYSLAESSNRDKPHLSKDAELFLKHSVLTYEITHRFNTGLKVIGVHFWFCKKTEHCPYIPRNPRTVMPSKK